MEDESIPLFSNTDNELRTAFHWKFRLHQNSNDAGLLRAFEAWISASAAHQRAFARSEALWQTVQLALSRMASVSPALDVDQPAKRDA